MKKAYSEMVTSLRRAHRSTGLSYDDLCELAMRLIPAEDNSALRGAVVSMETLYESGTGVCHIFMPGRGFCEWLSECARTLDAELGEKAAEGFGSPLVCLHFPSDARLPSALVMIGRKETAGELVIDFSAASEFGGAVVNTKLYGQSAADEMRVSYIPDDSFTLSARQKQADTGEFLTRMIAGLGLYMSCFPEQVKDGIPADVKRVVRVSGPSKTIGVSESVIQRDGVTPHYRSGHFRLLSSGRYVNKRGQVVFIHGCFVKGQAQTVLSPEDNTGA